MLLYDFSVQTMLQTGEDEPQYGHSKPKQGCQLEGKL